jgi:hypothetical protein
VFKHPLELLRTIVLPSTSQPPLRINDLNKHSTLQINQFLPVFLCYLILVFCSLFCYSSLIQQVCSVSYLLSFFSASVLSIMLLLFCSRSAQFLHCFLFLCSSSFSYCLPIFHSERSTQFGLITFSFIHTVMTVPLPLPMGESTTSVLATETLTRFIIPSRFRLTDLQLKRYRVMNSNPPIKD